MPHSLVLNLLPKTAIPTNHLRGLHLHALFLDLVSSLNSELATQLHHQTSEKAFTLSPLQVTRNPNHPVAPQLQWQHKRSIPTGKPCWWRISLLDETLFGSLARLWLSLDTERPWHLGPAELQVTHVLGTPQPNQPWANFQSYAQLYEQAADGTRPEGDLSNVQGDRKLTLQFCTPTAFRSRQYDSALPTPELVFHSLLRRWNRYSGIPFPKEIIEHIYPSRFDIETAIATDNRSKFIGCLGTITFQILGDIDPITIKQINTLANYALYAGVGRKTPMGMGMVRRIES
ncbi:MAG: CRISPR-associated endoribonuclease Cas6 [Cyanobacteria bacterium P01_F01_bin.150]